MNPRRYLAAIALASSAALMAACTSGTVTVTGTPAPSTSVTAPTDSEPTTPASGTSAACGLLTASDVQSALSENVTATNAPAGAASGSVGTVQECILTTDGPPLAGSSAAVLNTIAGTLMGTGNSPVDLNSGGIAVVEASTSLPISASAAPNSLPAGVTPVPGVGQQAYVIASPTGGGLGVAEISAGKVVMVLDLEGKQVTSDQLTLLLKAAVSHG